MSKIDTEFVLRGEKILKEGFVTKAGRARWSEGTPAHTKSIFAEVSKYNLQEEFPLLTLRNINIKSAIKEILWIFQMKSNNINYLDSHIWDSWADETGSIGKAYGYQLAQKHKYPEGLFDQVDKVLYDLEHNPTSRRIMTNMYNHQDLHKMGLAPCAYSTTWNTQQNDETGVIILNMLLNQRSQDFLTANAWNVGQYAILMHMVAQHCGFEVGTLTHVIADCHIYDRHIPIVETLIKQPQHPAPTLVVNPDVKNFYDFTVDDFIIKDYNYNEFNHKIEVAI